MSRTVTSTRSYLFVGAQFLLIAVIALAPLQTQFQLTDFVKSLFLIDLVAGVAVGLWAVYDLRKSLRIAPEPTAGGELRTSGIYSYIRHPMYSSVLLIMFAVALRSGSYIKVVAFILLGIVLWYKSRHEEQLLLAEYPGYAKYMKKVGGFIPK